MATLRFLGIDPNTDSDNSPTAWFDETADDFILQGWRITDSAILAQIGEIPERETIIRFPRRMLQFLNMEASAR